MEPYIKQLLIRGEDDQLDYKQTISSASKIAKTICAFANHKGGILLIGVKDNRRVVGIRSEDERYMIELAASFYCRPEVPFVLKEHLIGDKTVLECIIEESTTKPHYAKDENDQWWAYVRVKDHSLLASKVVLEVMKRQGRDGGTLIRYGKNEEALIKYLSTHDRITMHEFRKMVNISKWRANKILIDLVSTGIIRNHTTEKTEFFTLV